MIFLVAVALHGWLLTELGRPWPGGLKADANVYLELAMNLWRDGVYGTRVAINYPPGYPIFIAPAFAVAENAARFGFIYFLHAVILGLCSLALLPAFHRQLGSRSAWIAVSALQFLGATTFLSYSTQTEPLFAALLVAATGMIWQAWDRPSFLRFAIVGFICGLALCTRRTALVLPVALAVLFVWDLVAAQRAGGPLPFGRGVALALGFLLGLFPEGLATFLAGIEIDTYGGNPVKGHLKAAVDGAGSMKGALWGLEITGRHLAYSMVVTMAAPVLIMQLLFSQRGRGAPVALHRASAFALLTLLGLIAVTSLHILRDYLKALAFWQLYPRYVDPPEFALIAMALLALLWLRGVPAAGQEEPTSAAREPHWGWRMPVVVTALTLLTLVLCGPLERSRGTHYPRIKSLISWGVPEDAAPWFLLLVGFVSMGLLTLLWSRRGTSWRGWLAGFLIASWLIGAGGGWKRLVSPLPDHVPDVLRVSALESEPEAPLAVLVRRTGFAARSYYEPAFRSDHPVWFVRAGEELSTWLRDHPGGYVLVRRKDGQLKGYKGLRRVAKTDRWLVYAGVQR